MISLKALIEDDLDLIYEWENLPELWNVSEQQGPFSREDIRTFLGKCLDNKNAEIERLLICLDSDPIGAVDIFDYDTSNRHCGLGIFIAKEENRKKGYGSIALKQAIQELRLRGCVLIRCIIYSDNTTSQHLFTNAGFVAGATLQFKGKPAQQFIWTHQA